MIPTMTLPAGITIDDAADRCRTALEELARLEPNRYALAHWLATSYRHALVTGGRDDSRFVLRTSEPVEHVIADAKRQLAEMRRAASAVDGDFVGRFPARVHVVRVRDELGNVGFGPLDVQGATLVARALSLLLANYLTRPDWYLESPVVPESDDRREEEQPAPKATTQTATRQNASSTYRRVNTHMRRASADALPSEPSQKVSGLSR